MNLNDRKPVFKPANAMENYEIAARIEIIKLNRERKEQGLPYISAEEQQQIIEKHLTITTTTTTTTTTQTEQAKTTEQQQQSSKTKQATASDLSKQYGISNEALTSLLAMFSSKRQEAIAKASQKDTQIILEFKKIEPPKLGEKPESNTDRFNQINVHYNKVPYNVYEEIQRMQSEIADLNKLKQMTLSTVDENGTKIKDPVLAKNNPEITGLTDKEFSKINQMIIEKQQKVYQTAGLWMYGLPPEKTINCETLTLALAIEAGMYRLQFGFPSENPNYDSYLK